MQAGRLTERQTQRKSGMKADSVSSRQAGRLTVRQEGRQTDRQAGIQTGRKKCPSNLDYLMGITKPNDIYKQVCI